MKCSKWAYLLSALLLLTATLTLGAVIAWEAHTDTSLRIGHREYCVVWRKWKPGVRSFERFDGVMSFDRGPWIEFSMVAMGPIEVHLFRTTKKQPSHQSKAGSLENAWP